MFEGNEYTVLGGHGFIGSSLVAEIEHRGGHVSSTPTKNSKAVFHFASYTHIPFEKNPAYHTHEQVSSFLHLLPFCAENNIPFIYPSSALVYEAPRPFYHFKKMMEIMPEIYSMHSLALRIFPVYGTGEGERGHPTAIQQWVRQMIKGERPNVFGDGTQSRDFIFISDVVENILDFYEQGVRGVRDVGSGKPLVFNDIIKAINEELGTQLEPIYTPIPNNYAKGILCPDPVVTKVGINEGVRRMIQEYSV